MNKFQKDLERWLEFEEKVLSKLTAEGWGIIKNPDVKGMDFILTENGVEVKADHYNFHKWKTDNMNAYIEYEAYDKPSWIFKQEELNLTWWIHSVHPESFMVFPWKIFRRWVADRIEDCQNNTSWTSKWFRITVWWDGNRTKGLLVPIAELEKQAKYTYTL